MSEREIIRQFIIPAEIYELNLTQKILEVLTVDMPSLTGEFTFGLDLVFSKEVYKKLEFYQFPVTKEQKGPKPRTRSILLMTGRTSRPASVARKVLASVWASTP